MGRTLALVVGLVGGVLLSGLVVAAMIPLMPVGWRSPGSVWAATAIVVALCVWVAVVMSRPRRS